MASHADGAPDQMNQADHDLLVRMDTKLDVLIAQGKDHEERLRVVEKTVTEHSGVIKDQVDTVTELKQDADKAKDSQHRLEIRTVIMAVLIALGGGAGGNILVSLMNGFFH